ncbi:MAG: WD40/YVTN/BNR-like repeat-containing protein, partial [bacterium]
PDIRQAARLAAWRQADAMRSAAERSAEAWDPVGPRNVGGRIADVACHPVNPSIVYAGAAEGGVFKTTDGGSTWFPTFDDESSLSIGSIAIDPNAPETIWVGTGEPNGGGGSVTYGGTGVFKSTNGGATWTNMGLPASRHIGRVVVDPSASDRVFVAVLGAMWSTNPERGVYRTTNGGASWQQVHALNDSTGAIDLAIDPSNPDRVYAAMWERTRAPDNLNYGGNGSGIWRSTDGGDTWSELTIGLPAGPSVGRIGLSLAASSPSTLYAIYADASPGSFMGVYKTTNGGDTWTQTNDGALSGVYATYGWWFGNIRVDPANANRVFVLGFTYFRSTNGGGSWSDVGSSMHVDHHGQAFAPGGVIWEGNDGGMYKSTNGGSAWTKLPDLPLTQFYTVEVDHQFPVRRYGGTQDNGTNRTLTGGDDDWQNILGGDGFHCQVDPVNNAYVYAEWQYGELHRSTNGGSSFGSIGSGLSGRTNWSMPVVLDPSNPATIFAGTQWVYRSANRGTSWAAISPDLTDGPSGGNNTYATITTLAVAPTDPNVVWAGTDDANVWVTTNGGGNWTKVDGTLPERWVTRVAVDPTDATVSYVTISGFRWDEPLPHVFRSTDFGASWT